MKKNENCAIKNYLQNKFLRSFYWEGSFVGILENILGQETVFEMQVHKTNLI